MKNLKDMPPAMLEVAEEFATLTGGSAGRFWVRWCATFFFDLPLLFTGYPGIFSHR